MTPFVRKGDWLRAHWFESKMSCLAGAQMKTGAIAHDVSGVVTHIRGDHPKNPLKVLFTVRQDDGTEVDVNQNWVVDYKQSDENAKLG